MTDDAVSNLCQALSIPWVVFNGDGAQAGLLENLVEMEKATARRAKTLLRDSVSTLIMPVVRRVLEETSWQPMFMMSPRGRVMVRRFDPKKLEDLKIVWEDRHTKG